MENSNVTYYSDKLEKIIYEVYKHTFLLVNIRVVEREKALSITKQHLNLFSDTENHIYNTIKIILNESSSKKANWTEGNSFFDEFFHGICKAFIHATMVDLKLVGIMFENFTKRLIEVLKLETKKTLQYDDLKNAIQYTDKFFLNSFTFNLDDKLITFHKNIYNKALTSTFKTGISSIEFFKTFKLNIFKTYELEYLSKQSPKEIY